MSTAFHPDHLPRRIILSRKGADATWGGRPSLRVGDELISLPIPESASRAAAAAIAGVGVRYRDLPPHPRVGALHTHLRGIDADHYVHLDPDLRPALRPELRPNPRPELLHKSTPLDRQTARVEGLFGQVGAAERHLRNQAVGPGDLFLFFGWFRESELCNDKQREAKWQRIGPDEHCLWGWLQIEESYPVTSAAAAAALPWAAHHPHVAHWDRYDRHNRLYRARERLSFAPALPGAGVFRWHPGLTLTARCTDDARAGTSAGGRRSDWCLPNFFRRTGLTYNQVDGPRCREDSGRVHLRSAPIGQEFVLPAHRPFRRGERTAVGAWLASVFSGA